MSHPSSCVDPDCGLTYVEHLRTIAISPAALPSRGFVNRTPGQPDEPLSATRERQARWDRENAAFRTLKTSGINGVDLRDAPRVLKEMGG